MGIEISPPTFIKLLKTKGFIVNGHCYPLYETGKILRVERYQREVTGNIEVVVVTASFQYHKPLEFRNTRHLDGDIMPDNEFEFISSR